MDADGAETVMLSTRDKLEKMLCKLSEGRSDKDRVPLDELLEAVESLRPAANLMPAFTAAADRRGTDSAAGRASGSRS